MLKHGLGLSLILMQIILALSPSERLSAKPATCASQKHEKLNGTSLDQIARSIEIDHPPERRTSRRLLSVGAKIDPRQALKPVPAALVKALPQYRGYDYFLSKAYAVIVHPPTRRISYLLPFCAVSRSPSLKTEKPHRQ